VANKRVYVPDAMIEESYQYGRDILAGKRKKQECVALLMRDFPFAERTASAYIDCYIAVRRGGKISKSTLGAKGIKFLLLKIADEGVAQLDAALGVLRAFIDYLEGLPGSGGRASSREIGLRELLDEFLPLVLSKAVPFPAPEIFEAQVLEHMRLTAEERAREVASAPRKPTSYVAYSRGFYRSAAVAASVLLRAAGKCEGCGEPAPFVRPNGSLYLEVHHKQRLADDGPDTEENAIALCPNCHRQRHYGVQAGQ
jgi:5-methylcytosine-specific restriction protein A